VWPLGTENDRFRAVTEIAHVTSASEDNRSTHLCLGARKQRWGLRNLIRVGWHWAGLRR
jgi:hypothetical protein